MRTLTFALKQKYFYAKYTCFFLHLYGFCILGCLYVILARRNTSLYLSTIIIKNNVMSA